MGIAFDTKTATAFIVIAENKTEILLNLIKFITYIQSNFIVTIFQRSMQGLHYLLKLVYRITAFSFLLI